MIKNPWTNRTALVAVLMAFTVGVVGALSLRSNEAVNPSVEGQSRPQINWRTPVAFGTHLPALGDNIVFVSEQLKRSSQGRVNLEIYEPGLLVPAFSITETVKAGKLEAG